MEPPSVYPPTSSSMWDRWLSGTDLHLFVSLSGGLAILIECESLWLTITLIRAISGNAEKYGFWFFLIPVKFTEFTIMGNGIWVSRFTTLFTMQVTWQASSQLVVKHHHFSSGKASEQRNLPRYHRIIGYMRWMKVTGCSGFFFPPWYFEDI